MPLVLGSGVAMVKRIRSEEGLLLELPGYEACTHKIRYRMIPDLW